MKLTARDLGYVPQSKDEVVDAAANLLVTFELGAEREDMEAEFKRLADALEKPRGNRTSHLDIFLALLMEEWAKTGKLPEL